MKLRHSLVKEEVHWPSRGSPSFCRSQGRLSVEMTEESLNAVNSVAALYERRTFSVVKNERRIVPTAGIGERVWTADAFCSLGLIRCTYECGPRRLCAASACGTAISDCPWHSFIAPVRDRYKIRFAQPADCSHD